MREIKIEIAKTTKLETLPFLVWDGGCLYRTVNGHGQLCAAVQVGDHVVFSDVSRGLSYEYANCEFNQSAIMHRYNNNQHDFAAASPKGSHWNVIEISRFVTEKAYEQTK